jgi:hypothetical protein
MQRRGGLGSMRLAVFRPDDVLGLLLRQQLQQDLVRGSIMGFGKAFPEQVQVFTVKVFVHHGLPRRQGKALKIWNLKFPRCIQYWMATNKNWRARDYVNPNPIASKKVRQALNHILEPVFS